MVDDYEYIVRELGADNQAFEGATVLLCGSQGFLGRLFQQYFAYLNEYVLIRECFVICTDSGHDQIARYDFSEYVQCDLANAADMARLKRRVRALDYVFNFAGVEMLAGLTDMCEKMPKKPKLFNGSLRFGRVSYE